MTPDYEPGQIDAELAELTAARNDGVITDVQRERLVQILRDSPQSRQDYVELMMLHALLTAKQAQPLALDPSAMPEASVAGLESVHPSPATPSPAPQPVSAPRRPVPVTGLKGLSQYITPPAVAVAIVAAIIVGAGLLFWPRPAAPPVVQQPPTKTPAAKIANLTDAKWAGVTSQAGDTLTTGQQLFLQSGSAEITFNSQARVMLEGPAELTIVDAGACRLATGKLTARVPDPAKGFKVHTPDGTVTDLGTEFGVYVKTGPEISEPDVPMEQRESGTQQDGKQPPVTEVHVFKGKVDVVPDQLAQAPTDTNPKSQIGAPATAGHPKSQILSAGQAITISENKVQPLPAADPFKFALDKLAGQPRAVLLSEDFESYDEGKQINAVGQWIIQSGIRKGQGVSVSDLTKVMADSNAIKPNPSFAPPPAIGVRSVVIAASAQNPKETFPLLAREIDGRQLSGTCQVLIEFDLMPSGASVQPSLALTTEVGHTAGVELWHDADPEVAPVDWTWNQPYRVRVLLDVVKGTVRAARVQRSQWRGQEGWVSDRTFHPPIPKLDWTTPPRYAIFGYPVVTAATPANQFWLDNIRMEVISEK